MPPRLKVSAYSDPVKRWNFRKADWKCFCFLTSESVEGLPPPDSTHIEKAYQECFENLLSAAKQCTPRGPRNNYSMCHVRTKSTTPFIAPSSEFQRGLTLIEPVRPYFLGSNRRSRSSGKKLSISSTSRTPPARRGNAINKLTGRSIRGRSSRLCPVSANSIASQLVKNGAHKTRSHESTRLINKELSDLWKVPTTEGNSISGPFAPEDPAAALRCLKSGKSPGMDSIFPEFIFNAGSALKSWFCDFLTSCMCQVKIPKTWRRPVIVAIPKAVEPIVDPLLTQEQAGFRHVRSTLDQVTLLTQDIEDSLSATKKAGAVFVDLTAAYEWHRGLAWKQLRLLPDRHMVHMIMDMYGNRSFTLTSGNGNRCRLRCFKNGVP